MARSLIPKGSQAVDLSEGDHTFTREVHGIRSEVAGTFRATLVGTGGVAEAAHDYVVLAGDMVLGQFASVSQTGTDAGLQAAGALLGVVLPEVSDGTR